MKTAIELYKELHEEFCKGSPKSKLNRKCKTHEDLIVYAMELYADSKIKNLNKPVVIGQFCDCIKDESDGADVNGDCVHCGRKHK
jgi:hypothetical protein